MREREKTCAPCRILLPKVIASGQEWRKCWRGCLKVTDIPECARGPFTLQDVQSWGEPHWESLAPVYQRGRFCGEVEIPLRCVVADSCGSLHTGRGCLVLDACVYTQGAPNGLDGCQWIWQACVRMLCPPARSANLCFETELEIQLEINGVRWQRFATRRDEPCCPDLPLYPPPCH